MFISESVGKVNAAGHPRSWAPLPTGNEFSNKLSGKWALHLSFFMTILAATALPPGVTPESCIVVIAQERGVVVPAQSEKSVAYPLPPELAGGTYRVHLKWQTGGKASATFTVTQKAAGRPLDGVTETAKNKVSWQADWFSFVNPLTLLPGNSELEVAVRGNRPTNTQVSELVLERLEAMPAMTPVQAEIRRRALAGTGNRVWLLEGENLGVGDRLFATAAEAQGKYRFGQAARELAAASSLRALPAIVQVDDALTISAVIDSQGTYLPAYALQPVTFTALREGRPAAWLFAGTWAGPGGLSLLGVDQEARIMPNENDPVPVKMFDKGDDGTWRALAFGGAEHPQAYFIRKGGAAWSGCSNYAFAYVQSDAARTVDFVLTHSGNRAAIWLNGQALAPSAEKRLRGGLKQVESVTDQGNLLQIDADGSGQRLSYQLPLQPGANRLLVKMVSFQGPDEDLEFDTVFSPAQGLKTALSNPAASAAAHRMLLRLKEAIGVAAPSNLPQPGDALAVTTSLQLPTQRNDYPNPEAIPTPLLPLPATVEQTLTDLDGKPLQSRTFAMPIPGQHTEPYQPLSQPGYYAIQTRILDAQGRLLANLRPDGFSVIGKVAARRERQQAGTLKMATSFYWLSSRNAEFIFPWMARTGLFHNVGSGVGFQPELWAKAKEMGLTLTADFIDPHSADKIEFKEAIARGAAPYTQWYKSYNEIDIHRGRPPAEQWVKRTQLEYELVKKANPQALYTGGSLVRVATNEWFAECLKLGLDRYIDVWDVHAYPKNSPAFESDDMGNSPKETALGVEAVYRELGRKNQKDFLLGETGARCSHGFDARRWQADMVAKQAAWVVAKKNWHQIAFLVPWVKADEGGDIAVAHYPAEAALYTAGALIDGFPYRRLAEFPAPQQGAMFGDTMMLWTNGPPATRQVTLPPGGDLLRVDVVGRVTPLKREADGSAILELTDSPVYILDRQRYQVLTGLIQP